MKLHNKNRTSDEPNALAPGADKSEDVRAAEAFGDERLQASLREARGEDDPRGLAWIEEVEKHGGERGWLGCQARQSTRFFARGAPPFGRHRAFHPFVGDDRERVDVWAISSDQDGPLVRPKRSSFGRELIGCGAGAYGQGGLAAN